DQLQLDVYGEVMDALYQARQGRLKDDKTAWGLQLELMRHLEKVWDEPDKGIWESRAEPRHYTFSKVMCWVAFDRAVKLLEKDGGDQAPLERWQTIRNQIHRDICTHGYDATQKSFVQSYGSKELDASLLLMPVVGFLPHEDPRIMGTVAAVKDRLMI